MIFASSDLITTDQTRDDSYLDFPKKRRYTDAYGFYDWKYLGFFKS